MSSKNSKATFLNRSIGSLHLMVVFFSLMVSCSKVDNPSPTSYYSDPNGTITKRITYNNVSVDVVIDKPQGNTLDALLVFHGTVGYDSLILGAAQNTLSVFKNLLNNQDMLMVSVAYPEENLLFGDNILQCEAALLWLRNRAASELGITIDKIFIAGHSQGGYLVTRLNAMHETDGVIANGPGPLNLVYRCELEESGQISSSAPCTLLNREYGSTIANPDAYFQRSLLNFTTGFKSDILFVQGMNDSEIQMYSWPTFKQTVQDCTNCQSSEFLELAGLGHNALFQSSEAKTKFNMFINSRR
jgi:hypothetical protein